jgi:uncharacterized membrane protein
MKCICQNAQNFLICCNTIFALLGLSVASTGAYLLSIINQYGDIEGAPAKSSMIGFVAIGAAITFVACLGCCGAQYRKSEGTEKRGFLMLVVYAFCMAVLLMVQIAFAVSIYVWIGGTLGPMQNKVNSNSKAKQSLKQAENMINCTFNYCCVNGKPNVSKAEFKNDSAICRMKDGKPNSKGSIYAVQDCDVEDCKYESRLQQGCNLVGKALHSPAQCASYTNFRAEVAQMLADNLRPIAMGALIIGGLQFLMLIAALLNIFWCCGKSNKVQDDDEDYYDDVYY